MNSVGSFHGRWRLEVAFVLAPLLALVVLQYGSSRQLARAELIAHQSTLIQYMDAVAADVRRVYEDAAQSMLGVSAEALADQRFDAIARYFDGVDTSAARLTFVGSLDGCSCLTQYYDPKTGDIGIGTDPGLEAIMVRVSTLLRLEWIQHLNRSEIYVDELDAENRVVYRFVVDADSLPAGFAGFVIDRHRFEREYLPQAIARAEPMLAEDVRDNLILRVTDHAGRPLVATHKGPGQADELVGRFDFVFRDLELSARSRHTAAAQVLEANALTSWVLSTLMSMMAISGVLLTWRAARRERQLSRIRNGFVASVSHELRTPLASIAMFGELLRRGRFEAVDKVVEYGHRIEHESARLGQLIDNVLSFGRIESARVHYHPDAAAIEDIVDAALVAVDTKRAQGEFAITVTTPETRLPGVWVDVSAMVQVFVNLLDNAMKYSGNCRRVRVELYRRGGDVAVAVVDGGIGIAPDDQERIFEEFYRVAPGPPGWRGRVSVWRSFGTAWRRRAGGSRWRAASATARSSRSYFPRPTWFHCISRPLRPWIRKSKPGPDLPLAGAHSSLCDSARLILVRPCCRPVGRLIYVIELLDGSQCLATAGPARIAALNESATIREQGGKNVADRNQERKLYVAPRVVDFGAIKATTGDCLGLCLDGEHLGFYGIWPPPLA